MVNMGTGLDYVNVNVDVCICICIGWKRGHFGGKPGTRLLWLAQTSRTNQSRKVKPNVGIKLMRCA